MRILCSLHFTNSRPSCIHSVDLLSAFSAYRMPYYFKFVTSNGEDVDKQQGLAHA